MTSPNLTPIARARSPTVIASRDLHDALARLRRRDLGAMLLLAGQRALLAAQLAAWTPITLERLEHVGLLDDLALLLLAELRLVACAAPAHRRARRAPGRGRATPPGRSAPSVRRGSRTRRRLGLLQIDPAEHAHGLRRVIQPARPAVRTAPIPAASGAAAGSSAARRRGARDVCASSCTGPPAGASAARAARPRRTRRPVGTDGDAAASGSSAKTRQHRLFDRSASGSTGVNSRGSGDGSSRREPRSPRA